MHTISISESTGEYRFECTCGATGSWYGSESLAWSTGNIHKESADGDPDRDRTNRTQTPHLGY